VILLLAGQSAGARNGQGQSSILNVTPLIVLGFISGLIVRGTVQFAKTTGAAVEAVKCLSWNNGQERGLGAR
jgi:hypothetical protein